MAKTFIGMKLKPKTAEKKEIKPKEEAKIDKKEAVKKATKKK